MEHEQVSDSGVKTGYKGRRSVYTRCKRQRAGWARSQSIYFATPLATSVNGAS